MTDDLLHSRGVLKYCRRMVDDLASNAHWASGRFALAARMGRGGAPDDDRLAKISAGPC